MAEVGQDVLVDGVGDVDRGHGAGPNGRDAREGIVVFLDRESYDQEPDQPGDNQHEAGDEGVTGLADQPGGQERAGAAADDGADAVAEGDAGVPDLGPGRTRA